MPTNLGAAETEASHEVMELVRGNSTLNHLVVQLREARMSWQDVKAAIQAKMADSSASYFPAVPTDEAPVKD
jgi:hypothetical protein